MRFIDEIKMRAKANKKTIVLPETSDNRTIEAANQILSEGFANIILIGNPNLAENKLYPHLNKANIIEPKTSDKLDEFIKLFVKLRAHKGMDEAKARELLLNDPLYFGVALVKSNIADGMVAGAINSTANVLRAALQIVGTASDAKVVSSMFFMVVPNTEYGFQVQDKGVFAFADCALIQDPTSDELAQIAVSTAKTFNQITAQEPKVALLSHSTYGSAKHAKVDKVLAALEIAKKESPNLKIDGELQLDSAIIPEIGRKKAPDSKIAGVANVLVFPDIDAGNIGYKLVQRLAKADAFGPLTQGMAQPINDLSRGCTSDDIVGTVALTALQAQQ